MGRLNGRALDFWNMTLAETMIAIKYKSQFIEESIKRSWDQARFIGYCSVSPHAKKGFKITDLIEFDWDEMPPTKEIDRDLIRASARKLHGIKEHTNDG